jgi:predicted RNA-binding Zn-ribbon protein involved in translation (DUF1610 family)
MSGMQVEPMTEEEMYAREFSDCELHEELPDMDDDDTEPACPTCGSEKIAYAMVCAEGPGEDDTEWAECRNCGWDAPVEELHRQPTIRTVDPLGDALRCELQAIGVQSETRAIVARRVA